MSSARCDVAARGDAPGAGRFVLFVEGPRDREILQGWSRHVSPPLARALGAATVILGGRQPLRAAGHLARLRARGERAWGLCVLDRDGEAPPGPALDQQLQLFTWQRRHIEAYLLVPAAIRRGLRLRDRAVEELLRAEIPALDDEAALASLDAKRLLSRHGRLSRLLGRPLDSGRIARAMRPEELDPEARALLQRIAAALGLAAPETVVYRGRRSR